MRISTGRTNWRRFSALTALALAVTTVLSTLVAEGAVAASVGFAGRDVKVTFTELTGREVRQYVTGRGDGAALVTVLGSAEAASVCQSSRVPTPFGPVVLRVTAGGSGEPVTATELILDSRALTGDVSFGTVRASADAPAGDPASRAVAGWGLQADTVYAARVAQQGRTPLGLLRLPGLRTSVGADVPECF